MQSLLSSLHLIEPLEPRDAFFGGQTNATTLYYKADATIGEQIRYVDVTSLYPFIHATGEYPVGHPDIITRPPTTDISSFFGMAKVDILPPFNLFHPVLPHRQGGKLTFPLCCSCVETEMSKPLTNKSCVCRHSDKERMLRGTWCTLELAKAVELGYTIVYIHKVWHFATTKKGLFENYVKTLLKIKQESMGYPKHVITDEDKANYISNYERFQGIKLDPSKIESNPGRKQTANLMLNSFWGKFGENLDKPSSAAITTTAALFQMVTDTLHPVQTICICDDDLLEIKYSDHKSNQLDNGKKNIFVAAFTTCLARLKLYESLEAMGERVLYFDTDSVIYRWTPGQTEIPLGDDLGDMTNELEGQGHIVEFVSGGPKNYGYLTSQEKCCCKVRGFTLNVRSVPTQLPSDERKYHQRNYRSARTAKDHCR